MPVTGDLGEDAVTGPANPRMRPLEPVELDLLEAIWDPISLGLASWPVWDYVSRTLYKGSAEVRDAASVLASLPVIPAGPGSGLRTESYSLVWRGDPSPNMSNDEHVGLTIAGIVRLAERRPALTVFADRVTEIIGWLAAQERAVLPDPLRSVSVQVSIAEFVQQITSPTRDFNTQVPADAVFDLLRNEYSSIRIGSGSESAQASLTIYLRPFTRLQGAKDYLERIGQMAQPQQRSAPVRRGEELLQTLDDVSYVLAAHPAWKQSQIGRLLGTFDLETVANLAANASNQAEFKTRLSALATILDGLQTPEPSPQALASWSDKQNPPKSLNRLEMWLTEVLQDEAGRQRALEAMKDIKGAKDLRNHGQHSGTKLRRKAAQACNRFGIEEPIRDWSGAWEIVRARVADAFDVIRQEVAAQPLGTD